MSARALAKQLRGIGVEPLLMRNTARAQLASVMPPALLGALLGLHPGTATFWATHTQGNWTAYAGSRAEGGS